jgi:hypothetical protein
LLLNFYEYSNVTNLKWSKTEVNITDNTNSDLTVRLFSSR